ncbi:MAG TPA: hypothetical protein VF669_02350 [Tepidisphaeraceae bacterium]|jgi:hypothetical protein
MSDKSHPSFDVSAVAPALESLHEHVARTRGRIEITRPGSDDRCVLLSKEELDALEGAIQILSDSESFRDAAEQIATVVETMQAV